MFEGLSSLSDGELIDVMGEATRDESTAIAQRLAAVAELYIRREAALEETKWHVVDYCHAVAAEIAAVQNISHSRALPQVQYACNLRNRLPAVLRVFMTGCIDLRVVSAILHRTDNVEPELMPALDQAIADRAVKWMKMSNQRLRDRIDFWVAKFDPDAVRVPPDVEDGRYVDVSPHPYAAGVALLSGQLLGVDGKALEQRLDALASTVCPQDPRTHSQRRADACGALARGQATLPCQCGTEDCTARAERDTTAAAVIHVLAEQSTLDGGSTPGYLPGQGMLPAESVRKLAATAKLTPVIVPTGAAPEPGYRPSAGLTRFLRWRDLMCCWPGCDKPAERCDVDHTVPWPAGATHASDLKHYCRLHHLIKTFYARLGWHDEQRPNGIIVLRSPTGHVYTTQTHGAALFPTLAQSTGTLPTPPPVDSTSAYRGVMMPRRKRTREQNHQDRVNQERRQRAELNKHSPKDDENPYFPTNPPPPDPDHPPPF